MIQSQPAAERSLSVEMDGESVKYVYSLSDAWSVKRPDMLRKMQDQDVEVSPVFNSTAGNRLPIMKNAAD
jgi:hypothetical protein